MDDDSFEDAAELVGMLGKMMRRVLKGSRREAQRDDQQQQHQQQEQLQPVRDVRYDQQLVDGNGGQMPRGTWV